MRRASFVDYEECFVSSDRGSRLVHFYVKDAHGRATLAVIGTEQSVRHMVYHVDKDFAPLVGLEPCCKWRVRREVVEWINTLCSMPCSSSSPTHKQQQQQQHDHHQQQSLGSPNSSSMGWGAQEDEDAEEQAPPEFLQPSSVAWSGRSWTCRKRFRHYNSFVRNGIRISIKDFVFVKAETELHVAYVEDMYEDRKLRKKLRVRWFHKKCELTCKIPPPAPHPREVFFTQYEQVLSVECVDGLTAVLAPEHFDKCSSLFPVDLIHICYRQFLGNDGIQPLNICEVDGYWQQKALQELPSPNNNNIKSNKSNNNNSVVVGAGEDNVEEEDTDASNIIKRVRSTRHTRRRRGAREDQSGPGSSADNSDAEPDEMMAFKVGDKIELLNQHSSLRGCWFTGTVTDLACGRVKIRYDDIFTQDDESQSQEEWVSQRFAKPDKLGMHGRQRSILRPHPSASRGPFVCEFGSAVDAWLDDAWWEGVVLSRQGSKAHVYFPGEGFTEQVPISDLRLSRDWIGGRWMEVKRNPNALASLGFGTVYENEQQQQQQELSGDNNRDCCEEDERISDGSNSSGKKKSQVQMQARLKNGVEQQEGSSRKRGGTSSSEAQRYWKKRYKCSSNSNSNSNSNSSSDGGNDGSDGGNDGSDGGNGCEAGGYSRAFVRCAESTQADANAIIIEEAMQGEDDVVKAGAADEDDADDDDDGGDEDDHHKVDADAADAGDILVNEMELEAAASAARCTDKAASSSLLLPSSLAMIMSR